MIQNYWLQHKQQKLPSLQTAEPIKQTIKNMSYSKKKKKKHHRMKQQEEEN